MDISAYEKDNKLYYEIKKYDITLEKAFVHNGYVKFGDAYIKSFPLIFPYRDKIIRNYLRDAESMFYEEASSKPVRWQEGLEHFASIAQKCNLDWWTTGKILLPLNGIDVEVDDVDFYFHLNDLNDIYRAFSDYIIEPIVSDTWRANTFQYYGLAYSYCTVCLFVEPLASLDVPEPVHFGQYASRNLESINWNGYNIKVPPIELYVKTLTRWGKKEKAESIMRALHSKK